MVDNQAASPIVKAGKMMWKLTTKANWIGDRMTGSSSMGASLVRGGVVEAQYYDLGGHGLCWPRDHRKSGSHGNFLYAVHGIGNDTAANPTAAAEHLAKQFLAVGRIERIEVSTQISEEHDPSGCGSDSSDNGVVGLHAP